MRKRILSVLLSCVLVGALSASLVFAEDGAPEVTIEQGELEAIVEVTLPEEPIGTEPEPEPVIEHAGVSITPSGSQDFTNSVQYTVTAQDGTTKVYTVWVGPPRMILPTPPAAVSGQPPADSVTWTGKGTATAKLEQEIDTFKRLYGPGGTTLLTFALRPRQKSTGE